MAVVVLTTNSTNSDPLADSTTQPQSNKKWQDKT
jgi:hypothetical protein